MEKLPKKVETPKIEAKLIHIKEGKVFAIQNTKKELKPLTDNNNWAFFDNLTEFVKKWEWLFQYEAFCDDYYSEEEKTKYWITQKWLIRKPDHLCWRFSIWYWTLSFLWEVITYEEWVKRKVEDLKWRNSLITSNCLSDNQRVVVVDFFYQHWNNSSWMKYKANNCKTSQIFYTIAWWRDHYKSKKQWWMVKREQLRLNYFYK